MKHLEDAAEYLTEDLYLSSFLMAKSHHVLGYIKTGRKASIRFLITASLEKDVMAYYNSGKAVGSRLFDCYRRLKDMVFQR